MALEPNKGHLCRTASNGHLGEQWVEVSHSVEGSSSGGRKPGLMSRHEQNAVQKRGESYSKGSIRLGGIVKVTEI